MPVPCFLIQMISFPLLRLRARGVQQPRSVAQPGQPRPGSRTCRPSCVPPCAKSARSLADNVRAGSGRGLRCHRAGLEVFPAHAAPAPRSHAAPGLSKAGSSPGASRALLARELDTGRGACRTGVQAELESGRHAAVHSRRDDARQAPQPVSQRPPPALRATPSVACWQTPWTDGRPSA